jgi:transposase InsO family protein
MPSAAAVLQSNETDRVVEALSAAWDHRPKAKSPPAQRKRLAPRGRTADLNSMQREFENMPSDPEWQRRIAGKLQRETRRLEKLGIRVASSECRIGACRFEFVYSGRAADRRRERLATGSQVRATDQSLVHTWIASDNTVRSVTYLARDGSLPLG